MPFQLSLQDCNGAIAELASVQVPIHHIDQKYSPAVCGRIDNRYRVGPARSTPMTKTMERMELTSLTRFMPFSMPR